MAQLKDLIVSGVTRCVGRLYAPDIVGNLTGTASRAFADQNGAEIDSTYIKELSYSNVTKELTITRGDDSTDTVEIAGTEYGQATDAILGLVKLYSALGDNTDGTMTQAAIKSAINAVYNSPAFTGTATAPTVADFSDNTTKIATTEFVQGAIQEAIERLIDSGSYPVPAADASGEVLGTAYMDLLMFNVIAQPDDNE